MTNRNTPLTPTAWFHHVHREHVLINVHLRAVQRAGAGASKIYEDSKMPLPLGVPAFFIFFDEARVFLGAAEGESKFQTFRKFRQNWKRSTIPAGFFAVLMDTTSRVSNFMPTVQDDPSSRALDAILFPPFHLVNSMDVLALPGTGSHALDAADIARIFSLGRGLWGSLLHGSSGADHLQHLVDVAVRKLSLSSTVGTISDHAAIAALSFRFCLSVQPQASLADDLLGRHLAVCMFISESRGRLMINFPSEPVVAEAAATLMAPSQAKITMLEAYQRLHARGDVDAGLSGELVARLILQWAHDFCADKQYAAAAALSGAVPPPNRFSRFVPLLDYFNAAFALPPLRWQYTRNHPTPPPPDASRLLSIRLREVWKTFVFFTHFIHIEFTPSTEADLQRYFDRGAAICCKLNQAGVNLIIPVRCLLKTGDSDTVTVRHTCVLVQVKNSARKLDPQFALALSKLCVKYALPKLAAADEAGDGFIQETAVSLYLNVGWSGQATSVLPVRSRGCAGPVSGGCFLGIGPAVYPFLIETGLVKQLHAIRGKDQDPVNLCDESAVAVTKAMLPLVYEPAPSSQEPIPEEFDEL
eukprot:m.54313 g.54313  ORF g.54313 m.54313 type:complete len:585 (+) comp6578_c1_seq1:804-2558(+)